MVQASEFHFNFYPLVRPSMKLATSAHKQSASQTAFNVTPILYLVGACHRSPMNPSDIVRPVRSDRCNSHAKNTKHARNIRGSQLLLIAECCHASSTGSP